MTVDDEVNGAGGRWWRPVATGRETDRGEERTNGKGMRGLAGLTRRHGSSLATRQRQGARMAAGATSVGAGTGVA